MDNEPVRPRSWLSRVLIATVAVSAISHIAVIAQTPFGDEFVVIQNVWHMVIERTIFPPHAIYPALYSYMIAPALGLVASAMVSLGIPGSFQDLSELMSLRPLAVFWPARAVTLLCWGVTAWAVHRIARELTDSDEGALPALAGFASVVGTLRYSGYALPDVPQMMFLTLALMFALRLARGEDAPRNATWAGLLTGLAIATKYQAVAVVIPVLVAAWLGGAASERVGRVVRVTGMAALGFVLGCPGWVFAPRHYWAGLSSVREHMAVGHIGQEGAPLLGQLELLARADGLLPALAVVAVIALIAGRRTRKDPALIVLMVAGAAILLTASPARKQSLQFIFGLYPVMAMLVAVWIGGLTKARARTISSLCAMGFAAMALVGAWWAYRAVALPDSTVVAREWINANVPEGAAMSVDWNYVPRLLDADELAYLRGGLRTDFMREAYAGLRGYRIVPMGWTAATLDTTDAEWIVTSSGCYARFFEFGLFTMRPTAPGSPLREMFEGRRGYYAALLRGNPRWRLAYEVRTGRGPTVLVFTRRGSS